MATTIRNWAGNYVYGTTNLLFPQSVEQIQALVRRSSKLKVLGSRHSFNGIADSPEQLISLEQCERIIRIDRKNRRVTIGANINYGELSRALYAEGFALHNLASLPHISVVGACSTATHGSGERNQNLASAVSCLEIVTASGDLVTLSREQDGERFKGAVVGLGALGVVVKLTLDLLPAFEVRQDVYVNLPTAQLLDHFDEVMSRTYSVSLFTNWQSDRINEVWLKSRIEDATWLEPQAEFFGAAPAATQLHPIAELAPENCTLQLGIPGPWHERLPHFRFDATPSAGNELQSEYFVPRPHAAEAFRAISSLRAEFAPHLLVSEIRGIAADDFWMSPCYKRDSIAFHFTWKPDWSSVKPLLPLIEAQLAPFDARPHWGKLFMMSPGRLQALYEKQPEFRRLIQDYDPQGKFRNPFLDQALFGN